MQPLPHLHPQPAVHRFAASYPFVPAPQTSTEMAYGYADDWGVFYGGSGKQLGMQVRGWLGWLGGGAWLAACVAGAATGPSMGLCRGCRAVLWGASAGRPGPFFTPTPGGAQHASSTTSARLPCRCWASSSSPPGPAACPAECFWC